MDWILSAKVAHVQLCIYMVNNRAETNHKMKFSKIVPEPQGGADLQVRGDFLGVDREWTGKHVPRIFGSRGDALCCVTHF